MLRTLFLLLFVSPAFAGEAPHSPKIENPAFDRIKELAGRWEGTIQEKGESKPATATYEITSGGTVVMERLFAGTPHEMVTVYVPEGKDLFVTHYCAVGNQPKMKLVKSDKKMMDFDFVGGTNLVPEKDGHMHRLVLRTASKDKLQQEWTYYQDGKAGETVKIDFKRSK